MVLVHAFAKPTEYRVLSLIMLCSEVRQARRPDSPRAQEGEVKLTRLLLGASGVSSVHPGESEEALS